MKASEMKTGFFAALTAAGLAAFLSGCGQEESPSPADVKATVQEAAAKVSSTSPAAILENPTVKAALASARAERNGLSAALVKITGEMKAMVDAAKAKLPDADDAAVLAELKRDPQWNSLSARAEDLIKAIDDNRRHTTAAVGGAIKKEISK